MNAAPAPPAPRIHGTPGDGARRAGLLRMAAPLALVLFLAGFLAGAAAPAALRPDTVTAGWALVALGLALLALILWTRGRLQAFFRGAQGEQAVANRLARLPSDYSVFHGVRLPGAAAGPAADLDHVVVAPDAVWVVETKNWNGEVLNDDGHLRLNGRAPDRDPLRQVQEAAAALTAALDADGNAGFPVRSVVCFATNAFRDGRCDIGGVTVCNADGLIDVIQPPRGRPLPAPARNDVEQRLRTWRTREERI